MNRTIDRHAAWLMSLAVVSFVPVVCIGQQDTPTLTAERLSVLVPEPHAYTMWALNEPKADRPAYVKIDVSAGVSKTLLASSGNPALDEKALSGAWPILLSMAGDQNPAIAIVCVSAGRPCLSLPDWSGPGRLRSIYKTQLSFNKNTRGFFAAFKDASSKGQIEPEGRMKVDFTVEPSGTATHCSLAESSFSNKAFNKTMVEQVCRIDFGADDAIATRIYGYPSVFHPF